MRRSAGALFRRWGGLGGTRSQLQTGTFIALDKLAPAIPATVHLAPVGFGETADQGLAVALRARHVSRQWQTMPVLRMQQEEMPAGPAFDLWVRLQAPAVGQLIAGAAWAAHALLGRGEPQSPRRL